MSGPETIGALLAWARERLGAAARLDAEVLLAHVLGRARSHLVAWPDKAVPLEHADAYRALVERRAAGAPVAHLTGTREFWSLALAVTPDTLIPRPETETLVELALQRLPPGASGRVADLGTGTGAVALALATERPGLDIVATDTSAAALAVAAANRDRLGRGDVALVRARWCAAFADAAFDLIVSNPPYVPDADPHLARGDVAFEPRAALAAGPAGLDDLASITDQAGRCLRPGGWLLLEHGFDQGAAVTALLRAAGYAEVSDHPDAAGRPRVAAGRRRAETA